MVSLQPNPQPPPTGGYYQVCSCIPGSLSSYYVQRQSNVSILNVRRPWKRRPVPVAGQQAFRKVNSFLKIHYFVTQPFHFLQQRVVIILEEPDRLVWTTQPSTTNTIRYGSPDGGDSQEKCRPPPKYEEYR